jgi:hypothetical protein
MDDKPETPRLSAEEITTLIKALAVDIGRLAEAPGTPRRFAYLVSKSAARLTRFSKALVALENEGLTPEEIAAANSNDRIPSEQERE